MPSKNPAQRLRDIAENIACIQEFIAGLDQAGFAADRRTVYAVTRALEIVSEASRRLPDELKARHPELDWAAIAATGNVYRHEYESVDEEILWRTARSGLDLLMRAVLQELEDGSGGPSV